MRMIDADALKKDWRMGSVCETCIQDTRQCCNDYCFSRMDVCEMIDDAPTVNGWISVKDRAPEAEGRYLVFYGDAGFLKLGICDDKDCINIARWSQKHMKWWDIEFNREIQNITHWMPMAEPPKKEGEVGAGT